MITKDINGNTLTSSYDDAVKSDSRKFLAKLLRNGNEISCAIKRIEVTKGSCSDTSEFGVGSVIGYQMTAELMELTEDLKGKLVELQIGLLTDAETDTWDYISIGEFIVSEAKKTVYSTTITANGRIIANTWRLLDPVQNIVTDDGEIILASQGEIMAMPPIIERQTLAALAIKLAYRMGCAVMFDSGIDTTLTINKPLTGMTIYQVLQIMAGVIGGYVSDTAEGNIKFWRYSNTATAEVDSGQMTTLPDTDEQNFKVTGIRCLVTEGSAEDDGTIIPSQGFSKGSPVNLSMTDEYMTTELFEGMTYLIGYEYRPGSLNLSLGDPRIEGDDVLTVTDANGSEYTMPCHQVTHVYDGGFSTTIEAVRATNIENQIGTLTPFQRLKQETSATFTAIKESVEDVKAISGSTAQYFWTTEEGTDTGSHITEVTKEEFLEDPENGGGNLLIRSNGLAVRNGLIELASFGTDGVIIGRSTQSHQDITYHAMKMIDSDGAEYLHISDLRNAQGVYEATDVFVGDGTTTSWKLSWDSITQSAVTVDGVAISDYDLEVYPGGIWLVLQTAPAEGAVITCIYDSTSSMLKAYTLGTRVQHSKIGGYSFTSGHNNIASGKYAQAHGHDLNASGDEQLVLGKYNSADTDKAVILGNGDSALGSNALTVDWNGKVRQEADGTFVSTLDADAIAFINNLTAKLFSDGVGFSATDVDAVDPWSCLTDGTTLDYISIIAPLVKYCQALEARITALGG